MSPKEENEKLIGENIRLKKENSDIITSINTSRSVLETAKKQEAEGLSVLKDLADKVVVASSEATVAGKEVDAVNKEVSKLLDQKQGLVAEIDALKKEALTAADTVKIGVEKEIQKLEQDAVVKQTELSEVLSKIKAEKINLDTLLASKSETQTVVGSLNLTKESLTEEIAKQTNKLSGLYSLIEETDARIDRLLQIEIDTKVSTEAYEDRKAGLIEEISTLQQTIIDTQAEVSDIKAEITALNTKRDEAEAEYKASERKIFDLARREELLTEREVYARQRFKDVGLEY